MRASPLLLLSLALAACAPPLPPQPLTVAEQNHLRELTAGKIAGEPRSCLPSYRAEDLVVIGSGTIVFRDGPSRVWISRGEGACGMLGRPGYALVTRSTGGLGLCSGDIAQVVDTATGSTVGACSLGDFVPYSPAR